MPDSPLNVEYWASLYRAYEEDNEQYEKALEEPKLVDRARQLWQWKDLSRSIDFQEIAPVIEEFELDDYPNQNPAAAVREIRDTLQQKGIIKGRGLVTPAFLLHLASSGSHGSSVEFPIYDRRVWNAYVYLWGLRGEDERLYTAASQSPDHYANLCYDFRDSCPDNNPRRYEQALFMFGGFIMDLASNDSPTSIATIDTVLANQEEALHRTQNEDGYAMVDIKNIKRG